MTLIALCLAAFATITYSLSAFVAVALRLLESRIEQLAPSAQARVFLSASLLPGVAALAILLTALAPTFGWIADHCLAGGAAHSHPHICAVHHVEVWPGLPLLALATFVSARFFFATLRGVYALGLAFVARRRLDRTSTSTGEVRVRILPFDHAQAFVLGLLRPTLYLTRGLTSGAHRSHFPAVVAHERAHLARHDPLRKFAAGIGLAFHLPGIAERLGAALGQAQEMAADEVAARSIGSRDRVATALVALAKARVHLPAAAVAFAGSEVETRVIQLMDAEPRRDSPRATTLMLVSAGALVALAAGADTVHHAVEILLGALGN